jgi:hypothetical protein
MTQVHHVSGSHLTAHDRQAIRAIAEKGWTHGKTARKAYALQRDETGAYSVRITSQERDDWNRPLTRVSRAVVRIE